MRPIPPIGMSLLMLFFLLGCTKSLTRDELDRYLADPTNGLSQKQEVGDIAIEVMYRPAALLMIASASASDSSAAQFQYYILAISRKNTEVLDPTRGFSTYSSLLQTLAFRSHEFLSLVTSRGDTLAPSNAILERTYGMGTSTRILVTFPVTATQPDVTLHLAEFGLRTGNLRFPFKQRDIADIPALRTENSFESGQ